MRFGFWLWSGNDWEHILKLGRIAEASGWDSLWVPDHFMPNVSGYGHEPPEVIDKELMPMHECWSLLAGLAAAVPRVRIGALVTGNTYRHPAILAKQAATVDHISGGRLVLGLGAGWQENEHRRYGIPFGTVGDRADRLDETCELISSLLTKERSDFDGAYYQLSGAPLMPKPVQKPLPIMIGGTGERRTIPTTVRWAHEWNGWCSAPRMRYYNDLIDRLCEVEGREPRSIARSAAVVLQLRDSEASTEELESRFSGRPKLIGTPAQIVEQVVEYADAGTDEIIIPDFSFSNHEAAEVAQRFITEVADKLL